MSLIDQVHSHEMQIVEEGDRFILTLDGEEVISNRFLSRQLAEYHASHPGPLAIARQMRATKRLYGAANG